MSNDPHSRGHAMLSEAEPDNPILGFATYDKHKLLRSSSDRESQWDNVCVSFISGIGRYTSMNIALSPISDISGRESLKFLQIDADRRRLGPC